MELYKINKYIQDVLENGYSFDEETGEVLFDESNLDTLEIAFNEKVDNIICYIKNLNALNDAIDSEIKALGERKKANDTKVESLKNYVVKSMKMRDMDKLETSKNKISFRKSKSLNVVDESKIPDVYFTQKIEKKVDKTAIKKALNDKKEVAGCELVTNINLQIK